jgi:hypothetical protein
MSSQYISVVAYINGVRIYPRSVSYTASVGSYASFVLDVPPVPSWQILPLRSHCVVFFVDPVTSTWRMLCEGEYVGRSRSKTNNGSRSRTLQFRALHAFVETSTFASVVGAVAKTNEGGAQGLVGAVLMAKANGQDITGGTGVIIPPLGVMLNDEINQSGGDFPSFLQRILSRFAQACNVDAYYYVSRLLGAKTYGVPDSDLTRIIEFAQLTSLLRDGFGTMGLTDRMTLQEFMRVAESLAFYTHVSMPAPPFYASNAAKARTSNDGGVLATAIPELLYLPVLYETLPPACNVVFNDQLMAYEDSLDYTTIPTRVVTQLMGDMLRTHIPVMYLANGPRNANTLADELDDNEASVGQLVTQGLFSAEELQMGVQLALEPISLEKLFPAESSSAATLDSSDTAVYMGALSRYYWMVKRGERMPASVSAKFLPYVVPGFATLIEDGDTPMYGFITSVTHTIPSGGIPTTSIALTNAREVYVVDGVQRTAPLPGYINKRYLPGQIDETYSNLFGTNALESDAHAAMLPSKEIVVSQDVTATSQAKADGAIELTYADIDKMASKVVPTPVYAKDGPSTTAGNNIADTLRQAPDPHTAMNEYQYRPGTLLSQYIQLHKLSTGTADFKYHANVDDGTQQPPEVLFDRAVDLTQVASPFSYPAKMRFKDASETGPFVFGSFVLESSGDGRFDRNGVRVAQIIAQEIAAEIMDGTR